MTVLGEAASAIKVIEFFRSLGVGFKGMPERVAQKPHYRLGDWPEIGRGVVGREDLNGLIADQLGNRGVVAIVKGTGGIGKTTLARHHVEKHGERYHGILWVQADTETSLVEDLTMLAAVVELRGPG